MTESEIQTEKRYRYDERLGIMCGAGHPSGDELRIAARESAEWERDYRESMKSQREMKLVDS